MSKITPEDRTQRPINSPITKGPEAMGPKGGQEAGSGRAKAHEGQADEADRAAEKQARLAKTTGKVPPDRSGLETDENPNVGKGAERMREGRRAKAARDEEGAQEAPQDGAQNAGKRPTDDAAALAEAQRLVIKNQ